MCIPPAYFMCLLLNYIHISESVAIYIKASHPESCGLDIILALSACISQPGLRKSTKCSNESEAIHHPRSKYEVSHVIRTWQKVSEALQV